MIVFGAVVAGEIVARAPSDTNRQGLDKTQKNDPPNGSALICIIPCRWIRDVFDALSGLSILFAKHGPGKMPSDAIASAEQLYMLYRDGYNRYLTKKHEKHMLDNVMFGLSSSSMYI